VGAWTSARLDLLTMRCVIDRLRFAAAGQRDRVRLEDLTAL